MSPNRLQTGEKAPLLATEPVRLGSEAISGWKRVFVGPDGLRTGWRLLVFLALVALQLLCVPFIARVLPTAPPGDLPKGATTPIMLGWGDAILVAILFVSTWVMGKIERRKFGDYGLPLRQAFGKDFWFGSLLGFLAISGTLLTLFLFHAFRIAGLAIHGTTILISLLAWGMTFLMVGLFEEFGFRGYLQYTLASGIGFWPAAFVISGLFGLIHLLADLNENVAGSVAVVMFGLLLCLLLRRTGNLWCAVGFHLAYDWGETFFYGVPDSGIVPYHPLVNSTLSGPHWLTGGKVGPEASILTPIALLLVALVFTRRYRENRYRLFQPRRLPVTVS